MSEPLRVAFPLLGKGGWTGGINYLQNTLSVIGTRLGDRVEALVFLSAEEADKHGQSLAALAKRGIVTDPAFGGAGRGRRLASALIVGADDRVARMVAEQRIDVLIEHASFYGRRLPAPVLAWLPDFQHRHMPEMFERAKWWRRELGFRAQIMGGRTIMLSSETALRDLEHFYPSAVGKGQIVRFAVDRDPLDFVGRTEEMRATYSLPDTYFLLPNQFWRHKNHRVVLEALKILEAADQLDAIPPVVLTGQPTDDRYPRHFDELMAEAAAAGVVDHFRYLGLIPFDHVLALNASCVAMINPSRMEGWSTTIEEAKTFGTPLILSDIPIHREQAPDATFFSPDDPTQLAAAFAETARRESHARPTISSLRKAQDQRLAAHAEALYDALRATVARRRRERAA